MTTEQIIKEIQQLTISERIYVVEKAIRALRKQEDKKRIENAVNELSQEYKSDKELTSFTNLDFEDFYEAK